MPTICRVTSKKFGFKYGWRFKISSIAELNDYWEKGRSLQLREGFSNFLHSREGHAAVGNPEYADHVSHDDGSFIATCVHTERYKENPRSLVEVVVDAYDRIYTNMARCIQDFGAIYVSHIGAYMPVGKDYEELETKTIEQYVIPGEDIRIKQWPNGTHFYAYVGNTSVEYCGKNKWDTESDARKAATSWARMNKIPLEITEKGK